jgi:phenylacetate-coenzyme A ligase PaaK-like adenylate-forming protein
MQTQEKLLMKQIEYIRHCALWKKIAGNVNPRSPEEFRRMVPLTTYDDYQEIFMNKREDLLPTKVKVWAHTTGSTGESKWIPYTEDFYKKRGEFFLAAGFLSSESGDAIPVMRGDIFLYTVAPPPYGSGVGVKSSLEQFGLKVLPPLDQAERMTFTERIAAGFKMALDEGRIDAIAGITSVLIGIGKMLDAVAESYVASEDSNPATNEKIKAGRARAKQENRPLLPRDIFSPKVITCAGADAALFADTIEELWGKRPNECYGFTEAGLFAVQPHGCSGMVLAPDVAYLEFVPEKIYNEKKPPTVLVDELVEGSIYEPVITNFYGGCVFRYRSQDLIEIVSRRDSAKHIDIPTIRFFARADNVINLSGVIRLNERACWNVIKSSGVDCKGWTVEKEYRGDRVFVHFYIETAEPKRHVLEKIGEAAAEVIATFDEVPEILGYNPLDVTVLPEGTFAAYRSTREAEGADLGQIKPMLINPKAEQLELLKNIGSKLNQG